MRAESHTDLHFALPEGEGGSEDRVRGSRLHGLRCMFPGQFERNRRLPLAGVLGLLTSVCLRRQSSIQFTDGRVTVDETVRQVVLPVERSNAIETEVVVEFFTVKDIATAGQGFYGLAQP